MAGDLYVVGRTVKEIADILNEEYAKILPGLTANVFLESHSGSRIYVFGEVNEPGSYQIIRPTSIFEALAMAGSVTSAARMDSVLVFRQKKDQVVATRLDLKKLMVPLAVRRSRVEPEEDEMAGGGPEDASPTYGEAADSMFYLHPDDTVYVSRRRLNSAAQIMREVADVVLFNGWSVSFRDEFDLLND